ncbi:MAG: DUF2807 domain-containing protein [Lewinellaceae bacterium]|nr:DUF2807 domain-containing protein [Lewinellaceae bacterium]MCB9286241.1 DUF2807 domain-containing protein [Lewinellaceae bacterium]
MKTQKLWILNGLLLLSCVFMANTLPAQWAKGNGNVIEQEREVGSFDIIKVQKGINLYLVQGSPASLSVKADENLMDHIITKVEGNTLYLDVKGSIRTVTAMNVYVTLPNLSELHASGGSDVFAEEGLKVDELKLVCSGGSDTKMKLEAGSLFCETSGGSDLLLSGKAEKLVVKASGGSDFDGKKLEVINGSIHTSGASDVWVYATGEIEMEASGASDIHFKGGAKVISSKSSGGSDIHMN